MPYTDDPGANIQQLGRDVKFYRKGAEQFCAFAFDLESHKKLFPPTISREKEKCLKIGGKSGNGREVANWLASFWTMSAPMHTERKVLEKFDTWFFRYQSVYGTPSNLYIYSFLIPCQRDGSNGHCSDAINGMLTQYKEMGFNLALHVGWSNDDVDVDMAHATKNAIADLEDDDIKVKIYRTSIAK
ncbi:MAG TPA: hypothetical protein VKQ70_05290 [Caulobacteraceae bacterium]|jgi:hypothetical protein|nr:hypothetical protein [Caulobacteraceae bacterium]